MASGRKLQDQLDCIKSLANMGDTVHVLVGTYELLAFRNLSGQLSRRSADIHFRRYRIDSETDVRAFKSVLWDFQRHLPLSQEPDLLRHWQYCYERTIGCVTRHTATVDVKPQLASLGLQLRIVVVSLSRRSVLFLPGVEQFMQEGSR